MLIPKEKIQEAKEKLGDRNFEIIMENYGVTDYDHRNMKCLCFWHDEDTPSCVYNRKDYYIKCFGCGRKADIITSYIEGKGMTYIDACRALFDEADVTFAFGEQHVKTQEHGYIYPKLPSKENDRTAVEKYFALRGISKETLDYCDVRSDEYGNAAFITYDTNDVACVLKYKPSHPIQKGEPKMWFSKGASKQDLLFNMNRVNTNEPLLICEGECLTGDTEVLTDDGWVQLQKYSGQRVMQVNKDLTSTMITPIAYVNKEYNGKLYSLERGGNYSLTTTAGHNWVYRDDKGDLKKKKAEELPKNPGNIPTTVKHDGPGIKFINETMLRLWMAVSADGSLTQQNGYSHVRFTVKKERKANRIRVLLNNCGAPVFESKQFNDEYYYFGFQIPTWMTKTFPYWLITETSLEQKRIILDEIVHWDGNKVNNRNQIEYSTNIYQNAVVVQSIAHLCGYMSTIMHKKYENDNWKEGYKVSILFNKDHVSFQKGWTDVSDYSGKVYCVTVPSGMILVRNKEHISITGNCDCLAAIESGYKNAVSPLNGASSQLWITQNFDWLEQFDEIVLAGDLDGPGQKMNAECMSRLGSWRCKIINMDEHYKTEDGKVHKIKDINEYMYWAGKTAVYQSIIHAKDTPVPGLINASKVKPIDISQMTAIPTGFEPLDKELHGLLEQTVTIITGVPGAGKSSFINAVTANAIEEGFSVAQYSGELPNSFNRGWLNQYIAGPRHMVEKNGVNGSFYVVDWRIEKQIDNWVDEKLWYYEDSQPEDVETLFSVMTDGVRKYGIKVIILDNLMTLDLSEDSQSVLTKQKQFIARLVSFAKKFSVAVLLVCHPRKFAQGTPKDESLDLSDISGASALGNMTHRSLALRRVTKKEKESPDSKWGKYDVVITIQKDRLQGKVGLEFGMYYDPKSRRFFTNYDEYAKQYSWDVNEYESQLEPPDCLYESEQLEREADEYVFGRQG